MKKIVFVDMDGVLFNFWGGTNTSRIECQAKEQNPPEMFLKGFFRNLKPNPGAKEFVTLMDSSPHYELHIASTPSSKNLWSATEKMECVEEHFPTLLREKTHLIQDKGLLLGDYLIDDYREKWEPVFKGTFIWFNELKPMESWNRAIIKLANDIKDEKNKHRD
jgi:5'(3')-deoxyribonucleotidase